MVLLRAGVDDCNSGFIVAGHDEFPIAKLGRPELNGDHYGIKFQRRDVRSAGENIRVEMKMEALVETDSTDASQ